MHGDARGPAANHGNVETMIVQILHSEPLHVRGLCMPHSASCSTEDRRAAAAGDATEEKARKAYASESIPCREKGWARAE